MNKALPFSVFKRAKRPCYVVSFKDEATGSYLTPISTGQTTEAAAVKTAFEWYRGGIPRKGGVMDCKQYTLQAMAKNADVNRTDAEFIVKELQRRGFLKTAVLANTKQDRDFVEFLSTFWDFDSSPYIREKLRKKHGIHRRYCPEQKGAAERYWKPAFAGRLLGSITRQDVEAFVDVLDNAVVSVGKARATTRPMSSKRKNAVIQAGTIALSWAFNKEMIDRDVTRSVTWFSANSKERQILSPELAKAVFTVRWTDERARLANMLSMVTGMRAGEIQGLRVQDLGEDCLYVRHSWNRQDGLKTTKTNESRTVELPFPGIIQDLLNLAATNPHGKGMDGYIFWAGKLADKPMEATLFVEGLREALIQTGMGREAAEVYTFHGWRHYFASYMKDRVTVKLLQSQTGHKTLVMLNHYSDHRIAGDRERIRQAQVETFGGLLPDATAIKRRTGPPSDEGRNPESG
jgi:integrase